MMKLKPNSVCEIKVQTGIARFTFPRELQVRQYRLDSRRDWQDFGPVHNGKTLQWYRFDGSAPIRRFLFNNPTRFPLSFRVNVQTYNDFANSAREAINAILIPIIMGSLALLTLF